MAPDLSGLGRESRELARDHGDVGDFRHALHEEERGQHHSHADANGEIHQYGQQERHHHDDRIALGRAQLALEDPPLRHPVGHPQHDAGQGGEWNQRGEAAEEEGDHQQRQRVDHSGDRAFGRRFSRWSRCGQSRRLRASLRRAAPRRWPRPARSAPCSTGVDPRSCHPLPPQTTATRPHRARQWPAQGRPAPFPAPATRREG